jgi:hypothetical protein
MASKILVTLLITLIFAIPVKAQTTSATSVTTLSTSVTTEKSLKGLGLLYNIGKIYIKKSVINTVVGMNMPGNIVITNFIFVFFIFGE